MLVLYLLIFRFFSLHTDSFASIILLSCWYYCLFNFYCLFILSWVEGLSETVYLASQDKGKICINIILSIPHLWNYSKFVVIVIDHTIGQNKVSNIQILTPSKSKDIFTCLAKKKESWPHVRMHVADIKIIKLNVLTLAIEFKRGNHQIQ